VIHNKTGRSASGTRTATIEPLVQARRHAGLGRASPLLAAVERIPGTLAGTRFRGFAASPLLASSRCLVGAEESRHPMSTPADDRLRQAIEISNHLNRSHRESFGRGAGNVKTVIQKGFVATFLEDIYTPLEKTLISGGHEQIVLDGRFAFQGMMEDRYTAIVESVTGKCGPFSPRTTSTRTWRSRCSCSLRREATRSPTLATLVRAK
jgi:uncharacterized protein YbcI